MSSRSLAAARARRAGDQAPPVSGNRPVTSIGSQAAFAQQLPSNMNYNMPPPQNNVRTAKAFQQQQQPVGKPIPQQYQQLYEQQPQQNNNSLPFQKLSISDAIGLITLRLGRVEQWIIETDNEQESKPTNSADLPDNHKIIDNSVLTSIVNRLNSLEKNATGVTSSDESNKLSEDIKSLNEQFKRMSDDVSKHTIELAKNTEQVFRFNRELTETKDILKSFMVKYDMFTQEITQNFTDYENALADLERRINPQLDEQLEENMGDNEDSNQTKNGDNDVDNMIASVDLKNLIKQELANSS
jgi:hypothetical protein